MRNASSGGADKSPSAEDDLDFTCILVHGTRLKFWTRASGAPWTKQGSPLRDQIVSGSRTTGATVRFRPLVWSGKNLLADRRRASERLSKIIERGQKKQRFILVGHSHGGSIIAYFLNHQKEMPSSVLGCIFLSTPFVALKVRRDAVKILLASFMVFLTAFYAINYRWSPLPAWLTGALGGMIPSLLLAAKRVDYPSLERRIAEEQTASLPSGNYLFLRSSGDEAAAALSFAQISTWASSKLLAMFLLPIMKFVPEKDGRMVPFSIPRFLVMFVAVMAATYAAVNVVSVTRDALQNFPSQPIILMIVQIAILVSWWIASLFVVFGFFALIVTLLGIVVQAAASRAFGWTSFLDGLLLDMAVEPIPFGPHLLVHVPWSEKSSELTHSGTYKDDTSLRQIHAWVFEILTRAQIPPKLGF